MNPTTKTITITHGNGSVQTMEVPFDFDESTIKPITSEQLNIYFSEVQAKNAQQYLNDTDWYLMRKIDSGTEIPVEITTKRQQSRNLISAYRATKLNEETP
jgi:hypothetical protein